jgi:hypothetical protein
MVKWVAGIAGKARRIFKQLKATLYVEVDAALAP